MQAKVIANDGSEIYNGNIDGMPAYGDFVDIYEEAVNIGMDGGKTVNGWTWEVV